MKNLQADYGATGNAVRLLDGATTAGSMTFNSASANFQASDVGKSIGIVNALGSGINLTTVIAARIGPTSVTLTQPAVVSVTGAHTVYGTDDTGAFQAAFDAAAVNQAGAAIYVPAGQYFIAGPLKNTATDNAQVLFPKNPQSNPQFTIDLFGEVPSAYCYWTNDTPQLNGGVVIHSMASATTTGWNGPAIFGGGLFGGASIPMSAVAVRFRNIILRTYPNPRIGGINGQNIDGLQVDQVTVDTGVMNLAQVVQPTWQDNFGIAWPQTNAPCMQFCGALVVCGYYTGVRWYEFFFGQKVMTFCCVISADLPATYHMSQCAHLLSCFCKYGIYSSGTATAQAASPATNQHRTIIGLHDVEHALGGGTWYAAGVELYDPGNTLSGTINWGSVLTGQGVDFVYRVNGGAFISKTGFAQIGALPPPPPPPPSSEVSPDNTRTPPSASITDSTLRVWTLGPLDGNFGKQVLRDGAQAAGGEAVTIVWKGGQIKVNNSIGNWWLWSDQPPNWTLTSAP